MTMLYLVMSGGEWNMMIEDCEVYMSLRNSVGQQLWTRLSEQYSRAYYEYVFAESVDKILSE